MGKIGNEEAKTSDQTKVISDYDLMLRKIIKLVGHFNLSFSVIESVRFFIYYNLYLNWFFYIETFSWYFKGKVYRSWKRILPKPNWRFFKTQIYCLNFRCRYIKNWPLLDNAISSPLFDIKPYIFDADFRCDNTTDWIKSKNESIIKELLD